MRKEKMLIVTLASVLLLVQCKKDDEGGKLENPFGLLALGSDTSLPDGRYVIRTEYGCSGFANILRCDNADEVLDMNTPLYPTDHVQDTDSLTVWYVKKVRYISPDPDYALAFGYRIYQYRPNGTGYRFLSFTATATPHEWDTNDEVGDGGGSSAKASIHQSETYPRDPNVPTSFATDTSSQLEVDTRFLFQFYESKDNPGYRQIKAGGRKGSPGVSAMDRWKFCTGYWNEADCDGAALPPHFRSENSDCEQVDPSGGVSRRCYIGEFLFEKVY